MRDTWAGHDDVGKDCDTKVGSIAARYSIHLPYLSLLYY